MRVDPQPARRRSPLALSVSYRTQMALRALKALLALTRDDRWPAYRKTAEASWHRADFVELNQELRALILSLPESLPKTPMVTIQPPAREAEVDQGSFAALLAEDGEEFAEGVDSGSDDIIDGFLRGEPKNKK